MKVIIFNFSLDHNDGLYALQKENFEVENLVLSFSAAFLNRLAHYPDEIHLIRHQFVSLRVTLTESISLNSKSPKNSSGVT